MQAKRLTLMALLSITLLGFWGCDPDVVEVDSVSISPSSIELTVGSTYQLSAAVLPSDAPQELQWTSSLPSVANVNASGLVTAVTVGECDITVQAGDKSDICHITVVDDQTNPQPGVGGFDQDGASYAEFTVASGRTVHFSRGNLQYQAATETWRFAEHQYDCIGDSNSNISSTYTGWIDLFGWGTSGWNSGANAYQPWATNTSHSDYYPGGSPSNNLTDSYANADWGVYNAISNGGNQAGMWRTLTSDEWEYLLNSRAASTINGETNARYTKAVVNGTNGVILFPDDFSMPSGMSYPSGINVGTASFNSNSYTESQWSQMEGAGCIFLPAAGYRYIGELYFVGSFGHYWASTYYDEENAVNMYFIDSGLGLYHYNRYFGQSVRLVK